MRVIIQSKKFKKAFKKVKKYSSFTYERFDKVIEMLAKDEKLPENYRDHQLGGKMENFRDCHIAPDIVLIYFKDENYIYLELIDIGKHSNLFK